MKNILLLLSIGLSVACGAQVIVGNYGVQYVSVAPSGTCSSSSPIQVVTSSGEIFTCQAGTWAEVGGGGSAGTVTNFTASNLPPLFTTSVATSTTTPALSFTLTNAPAGTFLANTTGASTTPSYTSIATYLASPASIGGTTPGAGNFTTLSTTGSITIPTGNALRLATGGIVSLFNVVGSAPFVNLGIVGANIVSTTGNIVGVDAGQSINFTPPSGSANFADMVVDPVINGTSSGKAYGLVVAPENTTLTGGTVIDACFGTTTGPLLAGLACNATVTPTGTYSGRGFIDIGTTFVVTSGCGTTTGAVGGSLNGQFDAGQTACAAVITPGITAPHGFSCVAHDLTTNVDTVSQTATTTTTFTLTGTVVVADVINFSCTAY